MASALLFSLSSILIRFIHKEEETLLSWGLLTELPVVLCAFIALTVSGFEIPQQEHLWLLILTGSLSAVGLICIPLGFIYARVAVAAPFHYIQMLWGIALGYLIFHDIPDLWTLAGASIIIASGIWLIRHENSKA